MSDERRVDTAVAADVAPASGGDDWPAQAADNIVRVIGQVRDRTTGPAITAARGVVYGILAGFLGLICLVLLAIVAVRLLDNYAVGEGNTWLAHLLIGILFSAAGLLMWSKRRPPEGPDTTA